MARVYVTRHVHFNAAHRLHAEHLSEAENKATYGACNNPNYHGHNYELIVTVFGEPDPVTGMVIDLKDLKNIIHQEIVKKVDHKNFNIDVDFMIGIVPTAENIIVAFWHILYAKLGSLLYELELYETPRNKVRYKGE